MQTKRESKKNSRSGWLLAFGLVTAAAFTLPAMTTSPANGPAAAPASPSHIDEPNVSAVSMAFAATISNTAPAPGMAPPGMVWIPGGEFSMGSPVESESLCSMPGMTRDASPIHRVYVDGFWMDATELTNEEFAKFVSATGYITIAERTPTAAEFPGAPPENL